MTGMSDMSDVSFVPTRERKNKVTDMTVRNSKKGMGTAHIGWIRHIRHTRQSDIHGQQKMRTKKTRSQTFMEHKAKYFFLGSIGGNKTFSEILSATRKRFPKSAAGPEFEKKCREIFRREQKADLDFFLREKARRANGSELTR